MIYSFYPRCEEACPKVKCCPHLGGANVASVVLMANDNEEFRRFLQGTISAERERNARLFDELFGITFTPAALLGFETVSVWADSSKRDAWLEHWPPLARPFGGLRFYASTLCRTSSM